MNTIQSTLKSVDPDLGLRQLDQSMELNPGSGTAPSQGSGSFFEALQNSMDEVNRNQIEADHSVKDLIAGRSKNIHETMLQLQKADLSLKTMMQVRNKILEAYKEIMKMQV